MFSFLPARIAVRRRGLELGSPPPMRAAMVISRMTRVKTRPRLASVAAFLCLMVAHFECPDMMQSSCCARAIDPSLDDPTGKQRNLVKPQRPSALLASGLRARSHCAETYGVPPTLRNYRSLA